MDVYQFFFFFVLPQIESQTIAVLFSPDSSCFFASLMLFPSQPKNIFFFFSRIDPFKIMPSKSFGSCCCGWFRFSRPPPLFFFSSFGFLLPPGWRQSDWNTDELEKMMMMTVRSSDGSSADRCSYCPRLGGSDWLHTIATEALFFSAFFFFFRLFFFSGRSKGGGEDQIKIKKGRATHTHRDTHTDTRWPSPVTQ